MNAESRRDTPEYIFGEPTHTDRSRSSALGVAMTPAQEESYRPAAERLAELHAAMHEHGVTAADREWARVTIHAALRASGLSP